MQQATKPANETERIKALHDLGILDTPINPFFERITRIAKTVFDVPIVTISIIDSERQWFKSTQGLNVCQTDLSTSFCAHAILQNDVFVISDATKDQRFADNPLVTHEPHIRFYAGCPIRTEDGFNVGTLCIIDKEPREFNHEDKTQLKDLAALAQDQLQKYKTKYKESEIIKQLDQVKREKLIDALTGVWNREVTQININEQMLFARQNKSQFILAIVDVDDFKKVNDTYGHNAGDAVLKEVIKRIVIALSDNDIVGRWGGEEFIIIKKITDTVEKAAADIDAARKSVCADPIISDTNKINVSITIGMAVYDYTQDCSSEKLVESADHALYHGKKHGKNCCNFFRNDSNYSK